MPLSTVFFLFKLPEGWVMNFCLARAHCVGDIELIYVDFEQSMFDTYLERYETVAFAG